MLRLSHWQNVNARIQYGHIYLLLFFPVSARMLVCRQDNKIIYLKQMKDRAHDCILGTKIIFTNTMSAAIHCCVQCVDATLALSLSILFFFYFFLVIFSWTHTLFLFFDVYLVISFLYDTRVHVAQITKGKKRYEKKERGWRVNNPHAHATKLLFLIFFSLSRYLCRATTTKKVNFTNLHNLSFITMAFIPQTHIPTKYDYM